MEVNQVLSTRSERHHAAAAPVTLAKRIQQRLLIGFFVGFLMTGTALVVGFMAYYQVARAFNEASADAGTARGLAVVLNDAVVSEVLHTRSYIIAGDAESLTLRDLAAQDFERAYAELQTKLADLQTGLMQLPDTAIDALTELGNLQNEYDALADEIIPLLSSGQREAAISLFDEQSDSVVLRLLAAKRNLRADINAWEDDAEHEYFLRTSQLVLVTAGIFLLGALLSGVVLTRLLAAPISALNYFEHALIETAAAGAANPAQIPRALAEPDSALFQAYNTLITRMQHSEASRLDFMAKVVHSFRSPLAAIMGYAELVSSPALRPANADLAAYARVIIEQARRLGLMVEQVVTAVRIDDRQLDLILAPVRVDNLLADVIADVRHRTQREIRLDDQLEATIIPGDALYLRQSLGNLIDNAVKFSPANTPVEVTLRSAPIPDRVEIAVTDHGIGIAETDRPILFTQFGRVYNGRTRGISGSGLGLYIARYVVEQHHGVITVHSQEGQGATFVVTLPVETNLA